MNILSEKKINCEKYVNMMSELDISQIETAEYHILDISRVRVKYPVGYDINYGDLYISIAYTNIDEYIILEEFIIKAYMSCHKASPIDAISQRAKSYFNTNLISIRKEEVEIQFRQWFNDRELNKLNIDFAKIKEAVYLGEIDFFGELGYQGFLLFISDNKIYFVDFISSL